MENDQEREDVSFGPISIPARQLFENRVECALDLIGQGHGCAGGFGVSLGEGLRGLPQHLQGFLRHELQLPRQDSLRGLRKLHRFSADGYRVIADPLQRAVNTHDRRYPAQVAGARQVDRNEGVTGTVELSHRPIDWKIAENAGIGLLAVAAQQGVHRVSQRVLHLAGYVRET